MWTLFLLHLVSFLWYQPAPCLQQLYPSFFSPALSHPLHYSSPPPPAPVPSVYPLRHYPPPLPSPPSSNLPMRYSRDQLLEIQPSTPNFELVNRLRELRLGVGLPRKRGCRGGRKKLRSIQVVPSRNLHPLMVPPFLQPHPDLQSAVGNAPLSSKHPTHLPTTDCLLSITPLMGGQPSDAPALSPPSPLQQGGQSSNAPALSPPSPLPQGSQPIALALSPSSPLPQDGQPSDAPGLSPSSSTLLLCPSDSTLSICHLNSQSAVKTVPCCAVRCGVVWCCAVWKDPVDLNNVELQGYVRTSPDLNGSNGQQLNPAFIGDRDSDVSSVHNGGTPVSKGKPGKNRNQDPEGSVDMKFDDDYPGRLPGPTLPSPGISPDESGVGLIYSHHEKVPFKNFSAEVRAAVDVRQFLSSTYLALHLSQTNPDLIVDVLLEKMLKDVSDPGAREAAKTSLFTHDKMHQLNRTIQCTALFEGNTVDYDQNWVCAMCTVPAISEAKVGVAVLTTPVNLGRNCQECRFVVLILTPTKVKGTKNEYERARTFATIFSDLDFRNRLLDTADSEEKFKDMVATQARGLSTRHSMARIDVSGMQDKSKNMSCGFMKGIIGDLRRRLPHYVADYKDGVADKKSVLKSLSCTMFLYFACILPCIAFGVLNESNTKGVLNVEKVLYSQTFGGLIFALFGGTPQIVLLTTAPLAIYSKIIYNISEDFDLNFPAMYACVGLWNAFFLVLYSVLDLSVLMQFSTRSSEEIFALFISIAFSVDAFKNCAANFDTYYNAEVCDSGYNRTAALEALTASLNATMNASGSGILNGTGAVPDLPICQREISVLYLLLLLATAWLGVMLYNFTRTPYLTAGKRELLADYSLPIAVILMAFVGAYLFSDVDMGKSFDEDARKGSLFQLVDFSTLSVGAIFGAMGLGFCLSLLFFMDQNISAALVNAPQNKMKKGTAYHWDLLVIAMVNAVISIFAFPMVHAALPHSPLHVRALADVEERVVQGHITQTVVRVRETRVTAVLSHVLIGLSILLMFVLAYIPTPVLYGLFLYVAITALYDNQMFERITLFFTEQAAYPPTHYIRHVPQRKMHIFTLLQLLQLAVLCGFGFASFAYLKMFFPVLIFLLIPIRHKLIPKIVEHKYVAAIDHSH
ncbi:hypothetical protein ACOMHN_067211 [Nucella lapillus]